MDYPGHIHKAANTPHLVPYLPSPVLSLPTQSCLPDLYSSPMPIHELPMNPPIVKPAITSSSSPSALTSSSSSSLFCLLSSSAKTYYHPHHLSLFLSPSLSPPLSPTPIRLHAAANLSMHIIHNNNHHHYYYYHYYYYNAQHLSNPPFNFVSLR